jgi:tRNA dimethylallyltransferase
MHRGLLPFAKPLMDIPPINDCWFLTGPTASGKSAVGVELARRIDAEIISMDSMALYRRMDIGTAKPTQEQRHSVPHHLIDVIEPHEEFSLAQYLEAAHRTAMEIARRGRQVLFVGGTPLYLKGLLRGIFQGPPADWALRKRLTDEALQNGGEWLHQQVAKIDSDAAARLHPNDTRRLIRALEVYNKTGRPISEHQRQFEVGRAAEDCRVFVLDWPKEELHSRIEQRVQEMFSAGLVEEVHGLLADPVPLSRTACQGVGYREVIEHLKNCYPLVKTIESVILHTKQLAKRQGTWFRSLSECRFLAVDGEINPDEVAERIALLGHSPDFHG